MSKRDLDNIPRSAWTEEEMKEDLERQAALVGFDADNKDVKCCILSNAIIPDIMFLRLIPSMDRTIATVDVHNIAGHYRWRIYEGEKKYIKQFNLWKNRIIKCGYNYIWEGTPNPIGIMYGVKSNFVNMPELIIQVNAYIS